MSLKNKSRAELFDIWKKRLRLAKQVHKEKVIDWANKVFKEYCGDAMSDTDTGERYTQIAQVIQAIEAIIQPHLIFQDIKFSAKSKRPEWEKREKLVGAILNQEYSDIKPTGHKLEFENELAILDARLLPFGVTKTSYEVEGDILREKPDQNMLQRMGELFTGKPPEFIETPVIEKEIGHITERRNPLKVLLDYSALHITKQKFNIEIMEVSKDDLQKPRYEFDKVKDLEPSTILVPSFHAKSRDDQEKLLKDPDFKGFTIYEIHDYENRVIHTMIDGLDDFIEFGTPYPIDEGSQYSWLWFKETPNSAYPEPAVKFYRHRAKEYSYIFSQVSEQIDKFLPKIAFDVNRLMKPEQAKLAAGSLGSMIAFNGSPQGAWDLIQPQVNPDLFKYLAMTKELLYLESGAADFEIATPDQDRTATEAGIIQRAVLSRRSAPRKRVKELYINQANTILKTLQKNADEEHFVKVLGENDAMEWWSDPETGKTSWTKENIVGDFAFDLEMEEVAPQNESEKKKQNAANLEISMNPQLEQKLLRENKELLMSDIFLKFADENMGIKDKSKVLRDIQALEPGDEHTLWMQGEYPPISEREQKDPEFLMKHFQAHRMFIESPAFQYLPVEFKSMALEHLKQYEPLIAQLQAQAAPKSQPKTEGGAKKMPVPREEQLANV